MYSQARRKSVKDALLQQTPVIGRDRMKRTPPNEARIGGAGKGHQPMRQQLLVPVRLEEREGAGRAWANGGSATDLVAKA